MQNVFVYGTLKRGQQWSWALAGQEFLCEATTAAKYWMFDLGDYPGLIDADEGTGDQIFGEVYRVDAECRRVLDEVECVDSGMYEFREIQLEGTSAGDRPPESTFGYFFLGSVEGCKRLQSWD